MLEVCIVLFDFVTKALYRAFSVLVFSNAWIALGAAAITLHTITLCNLYGAIQFVDELFIATFAIYNFQRLLRLKDLEYSSEQRHQFIARNRIALAVLSGVLVLTVLRSVWQLHTLGGVNLLTMIVGVGLICLLYSWKPFSPNYALREVPGLKLFIIAGVWSLATVFIPWYIGLLQIQSLGDFGQVHSLTANYISFQEILLIGISRFLFIAGITIPFDIRDLKFDKEFQYTLPQVVGVDWSKRISILLITMAFSMYLFSPVAMQNKVATLSFGIACIISAGFAFGASVKRPDLYCSGGIDGVLLVPFLFELLWRLF